MNLIKLLFMVSKYVLGSSQRIKNIHFRVLRSRFVISLSGEHSFALRFRMYAHEKSDDVGVMIGDYANRGACEGKSRATIRVANCHLHNARNALQIVLARRHDMQITPPRRSVIDDDFFRDARSIGGRKRRERRDVAKAYILYCQSNDSMDRTYVYNIINRNCSTKCI